MCSFIFQNFSFIICFFSLFVFLFFFFTSPMLFFRLVSQFYSIKIVETFLPRCLSRAKEKQKERNKTAKCKSHNRSFVITKALTVNRIKIWFIDIFVVAVFNRKINEKKNSNITDVVKWIFHTIRTPSNFCRCTIKLKFLILFDFAVAKELKMLPNGAEINHWHSILCSISLSLPIHGRSFEKSRRSATLELGSTVAFDFVLSVSFRFRSFAISAK